MTTVFLVLSLFSVIGSTRAQSSRAPDFTLPVVESSGLIGQPAQAATTPPRAASFAVPPHYDYYFWVDLNSADTVSFSFSVSSWRGADDISFTLVNSTRSLLLDAGRVGQYLGNYSATFPGRYYLRFDNSYSIFTTKTVSLSYSVIPPALGIGTYQWSGNTIIGSLRNYGTSYIDMRNAQVSLGGMTIGNFGGTCGQTPLNPRWSCTFAITIPNGTWVLGAPYVLGLVTPNGNFFFPVVAGGNSQSTIQTQPTLITFQTVTPETTTGVQSENQGAFSRDPFVKNAFVMIGTVTGGILLIGAILGVYTISTTTRKSGKGLYGEYETRGGDGRRKIPILIAVTAGAVGLLTVSVLVPLLKFSFEFASRIPYLLPGALVLILITSILSLSGVVVSILRSRRKSLRTIERKEAELEMLVGGTPQPAKISIESAQVQTKKCRDCGAQIPRDDTICRKCGMPTIYLAPDRR